MRKGKNKIFDSKKPLESEMGRILMILGLIAFILFLALTKVWNHLHYQAI